MFCSFQKRPLSTRAKRLLLSLVAVLIIGSLLAVVMYQEGLFGVQFIILGVFLGTLYAVASLSFALIYGVMRFFNIAHGELLMLGAYTSYWLFVLMKLDPILSLIPSSIVLAVIGYIYFKLVANPTIKLGINPTLLASFGIALGLQGLMILFWSGDPRAIITGYTIASIGLGPFRFPVARIIALALGIAVLLGVHTLLTKTYIGRAFRAISQDREMAEALGINSEKVYMIAFIIACILAGISGSLLGLTYAFEPTVGMRVYLLKSIAVVVLGGVGSMGGVLAGGVTLGLGEVLGAYFIGEGFRDAIVYIIFLAVLIFKPEGLFGRVRTL